MRSTNAALATLFMSSTAASASAELEFTPTTARLEVRAAPSCTSETDLAGRISARSPRIRFVRDGAVYAAKVEFANGTGGNVLADLILLGPNSKLSSRRVVARSCAEAADAVAVIVAVTLDPSSGGVRRTSEGEQPSTLSREEGEPPSTESSAAASTKSPMAPAVPKKQTDAPSHERDARMNASSTQGGSVNAPIQSTEGTARLRVGATIAAQLLFGPAPAPMPGITAYLDAKLERPLIWSPQISLGYTHAWRSDLAEWGGTASFALDAGTLDVCALRLEFSSVETRLCGSFLGGRLSARGTNTLNAAETVGRPFSTLGAATLLSTKLGSMLHISARIAAGMNLVRDSFEFHPRVFYRVDPFTISAALGIGLYAP